MKWHEPGVLVPETQVFLPGILAITLDQPWMISHVEDKAMKGHVVHRDRTAMLCSICTSNPPSYKSHRSETKLGLAYTHRGQKMGQSKLALDTLLGRMWPRLRACGFSLVA